MIFNLTRTEQNLIVLFVLMVLFFLLYQMIYQYYKFHRIYSDYRILLGEELGDKIVRDKLLKCWDTSAYEEYFENTLSSMKRCKQETIIFTGLCQDHGKKVLSQWMPLVGKIRKSFRDYRIIIVENDSRDDTREWLLQEAEKDENFIVLCDDKKPENTRTCQLGRRSIQTQQDKEQNLTQRISTLATFRQVYWNYIQLNYSNFDYMCVLDWDLEGNLSLPGFFHGLYYVRNYSDVVACNSFYQSKDMFFIYDTYPLLNHYRCDYLQENKSLEDIRVKKSMHNKILYGSAYPIPVESAFGGLALYNIQSLQNKKASYTATPLCPIECEHTTFHKNLTVHIDPWMTFLILKNNH